MNLSIGAATGPQRQVRALLAAAGMCLALSPLAARAEKLTTLYGFTAEPDGAMPDGGPVFVKGTLYGTTNGGGITDQGTIYSIDPKSGAETVLHSFAGGADGAAPEGDLIAHNGILYGTTSFGGTLNGGTVFSLDTATGIERIIYSFGSGTDGTLPAAGLLYLNGVLYGTTTSGGASGNGTVFVVTARTGTEAVLHDFAAGTDGAVPFAGLRHGVFDRSRYRHGNHGV